MVMSRKRGVTGIDRNVGGDEEKTEQGQEESE